MSVSPPEDGGETVKVTKADRFRNLSVSDHNALLDATVRRHITYLVVGAFVIVNWLTYLGVGWIYSVDQTQLASRLVTSKERIITTPIGAAVIGATTIQLGALVLLIGRYVFPRDGDMMGSDPPDSAE